MLVITRPVTRVDCSVLLGRGSNQSVTDRCTRQKLHCFNNSLKWPRRISGSLFSTTLLFQCLNPPLLAPVGCCPVAALSQPRIRTIFALNQMSFSLHPLSGVLFSRSGLVATVVVDFSFSSSLVLCPPFLSSLAFPSGNFLSFNQILSFMIQHSFRSLAIYPFLI